MEKDFQVWENSTGTMFIAWTKRESSVICPEEPGNIETMATIIGVLPETIHIAIKTWQEEERQKQKRWLTSG